MLGENILFPLPPFKFALGHNLELEYKSMYNKDLFLTCVNTFSCPCLGLFTLKLTWWVELVIQQIYGTFLIQ